jgi:hypothetical protein
MRAFSTQTHHSTHTQIHFCVHYVYQKSSISVSFFRCLFSCFHSFSCDYSVIYPWVSYLFNEFNCDVRFLYTLENLIKKDPNPNVIMNTNLTKMSIIPSSADISYFYESQLLQCIHQFVFSTRITNDFYKDLVLHSCIGGLPICNHLFSNNSS